ncbi:acyl-CoA dehydrogenase family protein [Halalkalibacter akibai]|uniref:Butyryl-CoA dehydrogenase n=1 Tax=Halalkalibacter akibai (strain ATCC 43226 / DSM 21942 / CIP 109018 / JCM 9157 / 1139) TaxID=1236973 RepID=W4QZX7_HALA3|nr:acyl-CoA dehydrogenase family protein [Halalkalibacter akibai]GAE36869.1 butyryl-CoA dehydrogenase [Halalkalibacter akibai JCM 9157]
MHLHSVTTLNERKSILKETVVTFAQRAKQHDEENSFPMENIEDLKKIGYTSLTVPKAYGGQGLTLSEWLPLQELIAQADGSTALSIGWHIGLVSQLAEHSNWPENILHKLFKEIVEDGVLLNAAASEPETGSPTRGGKPTTRAAREGNSWIITGRKSFTSMAPALDYFIVSATMDDEQVGNFLIHKSLTGVKIKETWNSIAMRGTASHDLYLEQVQVPEDAFLEVIHPGNKRPAGWLLHIPACYLGIAQAAEQFAIDFATSYSPNSLQTAIKELPNVQVKIGENEAALLQARYFLYGVAQKWDQISDDEKKQMQSELGSVKYHVVNAAIEIVDRAMRVVGAQSLFKDNAIQRYYRDVRAGLHNPPMDDRTLIQLATEAFNK